MEPTPSPQPFLCLLGTWVRAAARAWLVSPAPRAESSGFPHLRASQVPVPSEPSCPSTHKPPHAWPAHSPHMPLSNCCYCCSLTSRSGRIRPSPTLPSGPRLAWVSSGGCLRSELSLCSSAQATKTACHLHTEPEEWISQNRGREVAGGWAGWGGRPGPSAAAARRGSPSEIRHAAWWHSPHRLAIPDSKIQNQEGCKT